MIRDRSECGERKGEMNSKDKMSRKWWATFVRRGHYFAGAPVLARLKHREYLDFIRRRPLSGARILKTDLFVEAKNLEDNYLPDIAANEFVGMDISVNTILEARRQLGADLPDINFASCDVTALPFKEDAFDSILSDSTLDHIPKKDLEEALRGLAHVLSENGSLILSLNSVYNLPAVIVRGIRNRWKPEWFFTFSTSVRYVKKLLRRAGLQVVDYQYILPIHPFEIALLRTVSGSPLGKKLAEVWAGVFHRLAKFPPISRLFCIQFILYAEKSGPISKKPGALGDKRT
jgi:SAM-dependent methyltransferase